MTSPVFQTILGIAPTADPLELLGLTPETCEVGQVELALRARLAMINRHPQANTPDAEALRSLLQHAATRLKDPAQRRQILQKYAAPPPPLPPAFTGPVRPQIQPPQPPPPAPAKPDVASIVRDWKPPVRSAPPPPKQPAIHLTTFDRQVLALLVAHGGWNAASRGHLVALASQYNVSVQGLLKVVTGLTDYARAGGPRLGVAEITGDDDLFPQPVAPSLPREPDWITRITPDLHDPTPTTTIKLALVFGVVTLILAIIGVRIVFFSGEDPADTQAQVAGNTTQGPAAAPSRGATPPPVVRPVDVNRVYSAKFDRPPTFAAESQPREAAAAAAAASRTPAELNALVRRLTVTTEPADNLFREWDALLAPVAASWPLIEPTLRQSITSEIHKALAAASGSREVTNRLLNFFVPPSDRLAEPLDIWRGSWMAGMLARFASSTTLSPGVVEQARNQLAVALRTNPSAELSTFEAGASSWLHRIIEPLLGSLTTDPRSLESWELWLAVQRSLALPDARTSAILDAVTSLLRGKDNLARTGPPSDLLGRLLHELDFRANPLVRQRMADWFEDRRIESSNLWVLTSMLAVYDAAPWFPDELILADDADPLQRKRFATRIAESWPAIVVPTSTALAQGRAIPVDPVGLDRWLNHVRDQHARALAASDIDLLDQLIDAARLNESAAWLAANDAGNSYEALADISIPHAVPPAAAPPGSPSDPGPAPGVRPTRPPPGAPDDGGPGFAPSNRDGRNRSSQPIADPPAPTRELGPDGQWAADYNNARTPGDKLDQLRRLRNFGGGELGPLNAEVFVREVYRATPSEVRLEAQRLLTEQFSRGPNIAVEMLDQLLEASVNDALADLITRYTTFTVPSPRAAAFPATARAALVRHALSLRAADAARFDNGAIILAQSLTRQLAALKHSPAIIGSARAPEDDARRIVDHLRTVAAATLASDPAPADLPALLRRDSARTALVDGPIALFVAARLAALELHAYVTAAEQPITRAEVIEILNTAAETRRELRHVLAQAIEVERAITRLWQLRLVPADSTKPPVTPSPGGQAG